MNEDAKKGPTEGPVDPSKECLDELVEVAKRHGFRIVAQPQTRLGDDGRLILGAVWGLVPYA